MCKDRQHFEHLLRACVTDMYYVIHMYPVHLYLTKVPVTCLHRIKKTLTVLRLH